jgi:hypothetical protein
MDSMGDPNTITTQLLTYLNVSATKVVKWKQSEQYEQSPKLNRRKVGRQEKNAHDIPTVSDGSPATDVANEAGDVPSEGISQVD